MITKLAYGAQLIPNRSSSGKARSLRLPKLGRGFYPHLAIIVLSVGLLALVKFTAIGSQPKFSPLLDIAEKVTGLGGILAGLGRWPTRDEFLSRSASAVLGVLLMSSPAPRQTDAKSADKKAEPAASKQQQLEQVVQGPAKSAAPLTPQGAKGTADATLLGNPLDYRDLRLRVIEARYEQPSQSNKPVVVLEVAVMNTNPVRKFDDFCFVGSTARLSDNYGNSYERIFSKRSKVELVKGTLYPGETIVLPLVFETNVGLAKSLRLDVAPPDAKPAINKLSFDIPVALIAPQGTKAMSEPR